jgi:Ca2+-binding EF-hand superfamily protein
MQYDVQELQYAMRRAGQNPTDIEVQDLINKIDNGTGTMDFQVGPLVIKIKQGQDLLNLIDLLVVSVGPV